MTRFAPVVVALVGMRSAVAAAEHLLTDLHERLTAAIDADDMGEVQAIVDDINGQKADLAAAIVANTPADPAVTGEDTNTGGEATQTDTTSGGSAENTLTGGQGEDAVDETPPPVAVVSNDPEHTDGSGAEAVIVTDHPNGDILVTPITSTDFVSAGSITVDPETGIPTADPASGVTLGETTVAADAVTTAAELAVDTPSAIVSAPLGPDVQEQ